MTKETIVLTINAKTERDADTFTSDLISFLKTLPFEDLESLKRLKTNTNSMDMGSVIIAILSAQSVTWLAKGVSDWIGRNAEAKIEIKDEKSGRSFKASGLTSKDALKVLENFEQIIENSNTKIPKF